MIQFMDKQSILSVKNKKFHVINNLFSSMEDDISKVPWKEWKADIIIDCSGVLENTLRSKNNSK